MNLFEHTPEGGRFLLVISPSEEVMEDVRGYKRNIEQVVGNYPSRWSLAHFTLMNLTLYTGWKAKLMVALENAARQITPFEIQLDGTDCFPNNGVIFLRPTESAPILAVQRSVLTEMQRLFSLPKNKIVPNTPHVTIARGLDPVQFATVWPMFQDMEYRKGFTVNSITLLVKDEHDVYRLEGTFPFGV